MAKNGILSERIEELMIWLAETYLDAWKLKNNDPCKIHLTKQISNAFAAFETSSRF
jgi:hypothetical protein